MMDATYKLTNVRMPVYVMLCVGPLGESEIVAVFLIDSEDTASLTEAMQCFKQRNSNWTKIRTVITDKDMAEREAIKQEFTDATLLLCLFHVLRARSREITTAKMHVTETQRTSALQALQRIAYSASEEVYNTLRDTFHSTMPASVVRYFESNWHPCRREWVLCWQQQNVTFGERTNNRLESVNRRLKAVIKNFSTLPVFSRTLWPL
jgi:zinc finger SWIM domain-containing protein 3